MMLHPGGAYLSGDVTARFQPVAAPY